MSEKEKTEEAGRLSGLAAGALAGAAIGTSVLPVIGTFAGAILGGVMGSQVGRSVGGTVGSVIDQLEATQNTEVSDATPSANVIDQLERLGKLREQNLITEEEFSVAKAKILGT